MIKQYYYEDPTAVIKSPPSGVSYFYAIPEVSVFEYLMGGVDGDTLLVKPTGKGTAKPELTHNGVNSYKKERVAIRFFGYNAPEVPKYREAYDYALRNKNDMSDVNRVIEIYNNKQIRLLNEDERRSYEDKSKEFANGNKAKNILLELIGIDPNKILNSAVYQKVDNNYIYNSFKGKELLIIISESNIASTIKDDTTLVIYKGTDVYKRYIGMVYVKIGNQWVNVNKTMLMQDIPGLSPFVYFSGGEEKLRQYPFIGSDFLDIYKNQKEKDNISTASTDGTILDNPYDDRISIAQQLGAIHEDMYSWSVLIGDVFMFVPPTSIRVATRSKTESVPLIRSKSSVQKGSGHSVKYIEMTCYFVGEKMLNGIPYKTKLKNGKEVTYYMNGLRQLIAQFKKTPILPISNMYLNVTHNIEMVALHALNISSVPGIPGTFKAEIIMSEFEPRVFITDLKPEIPVESIYNWQAYRYYIQKSFDSKNLQNGRTYLAPVPEKLDGKLSFFTIPEEDLATALETIKRRQYTTTKNVLGELKKSVVNPDEVPSYASTNKMILDDALVIYKKLLSNILNNKASEKYISSIGKSDKTYGFALSYDDKTKMLMLNLYGITNPFMYFVYGKDYYLAGDSYDKNKYFVDQSLSDFRFHNGYFVPDKIHHGIILPFKFYSNKLEAFSNAIGNIADLIEAKLAGSNSDISIQIPATCDISIPIPGIPEWMIEDDKLKSIHYKIVEQCGYNINYYKQSSRRFFKYEELIKSINSYAFTYNEQEKSKKNIVSTINKRYDSSNQTISIDDYDFDYNQIDIDCVIENITVDFINTFSDLQTLSAALPARQYLGGQDTVINMTIVFKDSNSLGKFKQLYDYSQTVVRKYRSLISAGFMKIKNEIANMAGVNYCLINSINVETIPNIVGAYRAQITLISFDTSQRNKEELLRIMSGSEKYIGSKNEDYKTQDVIDYINMIQKLKNVEAYPDLELPTVEELLKAGFNVDINGSIYPDPDFYISYKGMSMFSNVIKDTVYSNNYDVNIVDTIFGDNLKIKTNTINTKGDLNNKLKNKYIDEDTINKINEAKASTDEIMENVNSHNTSKVETVIGGNNSSADWFANTFKPNDLYVPAKSNVFLGAIFSIKKPLVNSVNSSTYSIIKSNIINRFKQVGRSFSSFSKDIAQYDNVKSNSQFTQDNAHEFLEKMMDFHGIPKDQFVRAYIHTLMVTESSGQHFTSDGFIKVSTKETQELIRNAKTRDDLINALKQCIGVGIMQINTKNMFEEKKYTDDFILRIAKNPAANIEYGISLLIEKYKWTFNSMENANGQKCGIYSDNETKINRTHTRLPDILSKEYVNIDIYAERARWIAACMFYKSLHAITPESVELVLKAMQSDKPGKSLQAVKNRGLTASKYLADFALKMDNPYSKKVLNGTDLIKELDSMKAGLDEFGESYINEFGVLNVKLSPDDVFKNSLKDTIKYDRRGRLVMAFPTFYVMLIDEGKTIFDWKVHDNFYGYHAIQSIDVIRSRKMIASTCTMEMSNIFSSYWRWDTQDNITRQSSFGEVVQSIFKTREYIDSKEDERNADVSLNMLKPGARLHVRIGYTSNINDMPIVFNGTITEVQQGEIVKIIAQGDGIELTKKLLASPKDTDVDALGEDPFSRFAHWISGGESEPRDAILKLLTTKGSWWRETLYNMTKGKFYNSSPYGISHFGSDKFKDIHEDGEIAQNIFPVLKSLQTSDGKIIIPFDDYYGSDEPNFAMYLFNKTLWDVINIATMLGPDYIASVEPFEFRSTLFVGKPYYPMAYGYNYNDDGTMTEKRKTFQQMHVLTSATDILDNQIKASSNGVYNGVVGNFMGEGWGGRKTTSQTPLILADSDIWPQVTKIAQIDTQYYSKGIPIVGLIPFVNAADKYFDGMDKAIRIATSSLVTYMKDMYQGQLTIIGYPAIKPYDAMYIYDEYNDIYGLAEVQQVVHHMSLKDGYITTIVPDACVTAHDIITKQRWSMASVIAPAAVSLTIKAISYMMGSRMLGVVKVASGAIAKFITTETNHKIIISGLEKLQGFGEKLFKSEKIAKKASKLNSKTQNILKKAKDAAQAVQKASLDANLKTIRQYGKYIDDIIKGSMALSVVVGIAEVAAMYIFERCLIEWIYRWLKNRQAVAMTLLKQNGNEIAAGINGHAGLVIGDSPSVKDKIVNRVFGSELAQIFIGSDVQSILNVTYNNISYNPANGKFNVIYPSYSEQFKMRYLADVEATLLEESILRISNINNANAEDFVTPQFINSKTNPGYYKPVVYIAGGSELISVLREESGAIYNLLTAKSSNIKVNTSYIKSAFNDRKDDLKRYSWVKDYKDLAQINKKSQYEWYTLFEAISRAAATANPYCTVYITSMYRPYSVYASGKRTMHSVGLAVDIQLDDKHMNKSSTTGQLNPDIACGIIRAIEVLPFVTEVIYGDNSVVDKCRSINGKNSKVVYDKDHKNHIHISIGFPTGNKSTKTTSS